MKTRMNSFWMVDPNNKLPFILVNGFFILLSQSVIAAPGLLEDKPLFTKTNVQSNIMIIADDSGSMNWESIVNDGSGEGIVDGYYYFDFTPDDRDERLQLCAGYNLMAYNPYINYTPWKGVDEDDNEFVDRTITTGCTEPYDNDNCTVDLSSHYYWQWTDSNSNGIYDTGECGDISSNNCSSADCLTPADQTNYANWYSYYRKRSFVAKRALSEVVENSRERVGLRTLHNHNAVATDISDIDVLSKIDNPSADEDDTIPDPYDVARINKENLMANIIAIGASNGTPLRQRLEDVGNYFEGDSSPIQYSCQQNFSVLMTDGFWNGDTPTLSGSISDADGDDNTNYDARSYADSADGYDVDFVTLADVAMHFYERDLKTGMINDVPPNSAFDDLNEAQHMVTYTVAFGLEGTLSTNPPNRDDAFNWWPDITQDPTRSNTRNTDRTIDDLRHAAWNGRGQFLESKDPQSVVDRLNDAFSDITGRGSSAAAVAFNSNTLGANSALYLAIFKSGDWTGDLLAYNLDSANGNVSSSDNWSAADKLDARDLSVAPRTIFTYNRASSNAGSTGVPFRWDNISPEMQNDLLKKPDRSPDTVTNAQARLDFLRGSTVEEDGLFRDRKSRLGDIVHAAPVFVGSPEMNWPTPSPGDTSAFPKVIDNGDGTYDYSNTYKHFKEQNLNRQGIIYVGANDGMLHGFNADTGEEIMAYVPSYLTSTGFEQGLHYLTDKSYRHKYYVDLSPTVVDAQLNGSWRTILVGGGAAGGRGIFALDVTNSAYSETNTTSGDTTSGPAEAVLWEFTNKDYANLGYTFSEPLIVPFKWTDGSNDKLKWAVVLGNGYNSYDYDTATDPTDPSLAFTDDFNRKPTAQAELIILFLDADLTDGWTKGSDYLVINTKAGSTNGDGDGDSKTFDLASSGNLSNGLSSPAIIDIDEDKIADRIYAGDLKGNMWVFDVSDILPAGITGHTWGPAYGDVTTPVSMFRGKTIPQAITMRPSVYKNTAKRLTGNEPNVMVAFGTGQYMAAGDVTNTSTQSFYAIWDNGSSALRRGDLKSYTITEITDGGDSYRVLGSSSLSLFNSKHGWYMDLPTSGERVVTNPVIRNETLFFNTTIPDDRACSAGGTGWLMSVDAMYGGEPTSPVFDVHHYGETGYGSVDSNDTVTDGTDTYNPAGEQFSKGIPTDPSFLGDKQYTPGSKTGTSDEIHIRDVEHIDGPDVDRVSWQEINPSNGIGY